MHLTHQAKFLVGVKPFLAIKSFLILILIVFITVLLMYS